MAFLLPDSPADPDLYNAAAFAADDFEDGLINEDAYLSTMAAYQRAEREQLERAWRAA